MQTVEAFPGENADVRRSRSFRLVHMGRNLHQRQTPDAPQFSTFSPRPAETEILLLPSRRLFHVLSSYSSLMGCLNAEHICWWHVCFDRGRCTRVGAVKFVHLIQDSDIRAFPVLISLKQSVVQTFPKRRDYTTNLRRTNFHNRHKNHTACFFPTVGGTRLSESNSWREKNSLV